MTKKEALQSALDQIKEYGYISEDGVLDVCDEEMSLVRYVDKHFTKMVKDGELSHVEYGI